MDPLEVLNLFDSCWFNLEIFKKQSQALNFEENPNHQNQENPPEPKISSLSRIHARSESDQLSSMSCFSSSSLSPNSVLITPHLQTILAGKEVVESLTPPPPPPPPIEAEHHLMKSRSMRRTRTKKGMTKSLSDLEFEELKGFIDLGFVFSEEDRNSSLVDIIPGLQRLGKKLDGDDQKEQEEMMMTGSDHESSVKRPYLSEAWEVLDRRRRREKQNPLVNWRIPDLGNEINLKDSLKLWAHTVASTVR